MPAKTRSNRSIEFQTVATPSGPRKFRGVRKTPLLEEWSMIVGQFCLKCNAEHLVSTSSGVRPVKDLRTGDLVETLDGLLTVEYVGPTGRRVRMYDLTDVDDPSHLYFAGGISSHNCQFFGSSYTLVDGEKLKEMRSKVETSPNPMEELDIDGMKVRVWRRPLKDHCYVLSADSADGVGNDYSVVTVFDITSPLEAEQVASWDNNKVTPSQFAFLIAKLGTLYNVCPVMVESNNVGKEVIGFLNKVYEYEFIVSYGWRRLGIYSLPTVKATACRNLKRMIESSETKIILNEPRLLEQLEYYEKSSTRSGKEAYSAKSGKNDDHVSALMWALLFLIEEIVEYYYDVDWKQVGTEKFPSSVKRTIEDSPQEIERNREEFSNALDQVHKRIERGLISLQRGGEDEEKDESDKSCDDFLEDEESEVSNVGFFG